MNMCEESISPIDTGVAAITIATSIQCPIYSHIIKYRSIWSRSCIERNDISFTDRNWGVITRVVLLSIDISGTD
jgi:hypothetical protein